MDSRPDSATARLAALDQKVLWHPFTAQHAWMAEPPLVIERGEGAYLFDTDGRRLLDGVSSLWCNVHGHRHPALDQALRVQIDLLAHSTLLGASHPPAIELGRELTERAPVGLTRVFFSDDGATAVEVAVKLAFQYHRQKPTPEPERTHFIALGGAYHGDTLGDVSLGDVSHFHGLFAPLCFPVLRSPSPFPYRSPFGPEPEACVAACLDALDRLLGRHAGKVAAVVMEPLVQGAAGIIVHPPGFLKGVRALTQQHGTLLVADEVAVGFGRTGRMFACQQEDVTPDLMCLAKGITGGYLPLAATLTTEAIFEAFLGDADDPRTFFHGHTYGGNPLAAAVALANLRVFDEERTIERIQPVARHLASRLVEFWDHPNVGDVRQRGLMAGIELVADRTTKAPLPTRDRTGARVCRRARDHGVLLRPLGDVLVILPPLCATTDQVDELVEGLKRALWDVLPCNRR